MLSLPRVVSHPSRGFALQSPNPELHAASSHLPAVHFAVALGKEHALLQLPQWSALEARSASQPVVASLSQSPHPALQTRMEHLPAAHTETAWGSVQEHPHWWGVPPPPQVSPATQVPQSTSPQPVSTFPQVACTWAQVLGVQPHCAGVPAPPHVVGEAQSPQERTPPHPSETLPHEAPTWEQVFGVHTPVPHVLALPPPPHVWPDGQAPQSTVAPQESGSVPQVAPSWRQVLPTHPHALGLPPTPHTNGGVHPPQSMAAPH
jgi:hypothetical protein